MKNSRSLSTFRATRIDNRERHTKSSGIYDTLQLTGHLEDHEAHIRLSHSTRHQRPGQKAREEKSIHGVFNEKTMTKSVTIKRRQVLNVNDILQTREMTGHDRRPVRPINIIPCRVQTQHLNAFRLP